MLKGINRQMIEVSGVDSPYFERAFFVLHPDCADPEIAHIHEEARRMLQAAGGYTALQRNRQRARRLRFLWGGVGMVTGLLVGVAVAWL